MAKEHGNYAVLNASQMPAGGSCTFSLGNRKVVNTAITTTTLPLTIGVPTSDTQIYYAEFKLGTVGQDANYAGVAPSDWRGWTHTDTSSPPYADQLGTVIAGSVSINNASGSIIIRFDTSNQAGTTDPAVGDCYCVAVKGLKAWVGLFDVSASNTKWITQDGTERTSDEPAAGTNASYTFPATVQQLVAGTSVRRNEGNGNIELLVEPDQWLGTPPSGAVPFATQYLPEPAIIKPTDFFGAIIYEGTGAELETGDTGVATLSFKPDWVWIKNRDATDSHMIFDSVRLATNRLHADTNGMQTAVAQSLKSFDADGFTLGTDVQVNTNNESYVAWCWKAGGAPTTDNVSDSGSPGQTPTSGSVFRGGVASTTAFASANIYPTRASIASHGGFSIVRYTATGTAGHTLPHGLSVAPEVMLIKEITDDSNDSTNSWVMYHDSAVAGDTDPPEDGYLHLDTDVSYRDGDAVWMDTVPSSTLVTLGDSSYVNRGIGSGEDASTYIAYFFSHIEGLQSFGGYVGNNSTDGPFIYCGFKPAVVIIKETDADSTNWRIYDNVRDGFNPSDKYLRSNTNEVDNTGGAVDFLSSGFKIKNTGAENNGSLDNYIYLAFAETPLIATGVNQGRAK